MAWLIGRHLKIDTEGTENPVTVTDTSAQEPIHNTTPSDSTHTRSRACPLPVRPRTAPSPVTTRCHPEGEPGRFWEWFVTDRGPGQPWRPGTPVPAVRGRPRRRQGDQGPRPALPGDLHGERDEEAGTRRRRADHARRSPHRPRPGVPPRRARRRSPQEQPRRDAAGDHRRHPAHRALPVGAIYRSHSVRADRPTPVGWDGHVCCETSGAAVGGGHRPAGRAPARTAQVVTSSCLTRAGRRVGPRLCLRSRVGAPLSHSLDQVTPRRDRWAMWTLSGHWSRKSPPVDHDWGARMQALTCHLPSGGRGRFRTADIRLVRAALYH